MIRSSKLLALLLFGTSFLAASVPVITVTATPTSGSAAPLVGGLAPLSVKLVATCTTCVSYAWEFGDGQSQIVPGPSQSHVYQNAGVYYASVKATDATGSTVSGYAIVTVNLDEDNIYCPESTFVSDSPTDGAASLPVACINSSLAHSPSPGKVVPLAAGGNLSAAYAALQCGQTLALAHGASWPISGTTFGPKGCDDQHWITITSDGALPPEGTRVRATDLPQLAVFSMKAGGVAQALAVDHVRFTGIAYLKLPGGALVSFVSTVGAHDVTFDRIYAHGNPGEETRRWIDLSGSSRVAIVESVVDEMHCLAYPLGSCVDSQAIFGGTGTLPQGTYKIVNNALSAAGETVIFGGGGGTTTPYDIEVRRNYMYKPMTWDPSDPTYAGVKYIVKNLFELKNGSRVLVESNVFANVWGGFSQTGAAILITPKNQSGACPSCFVSDFTFRYNIVSSAGGFMQIAQAPVLLPTVPVTFAWTAGGHTYSIHDDVFDNLGYSTCFGCSTMLGELVSGTATSPPNPANNTLHDVTIDHITVITAPAWRGQTAFGGILWVHGPPAVNATGSPQIYGIRMQNSILPAGTAGFYPTGGTITTDCAVPGPSATKTLAQMITSCWAGSSSFDGNVIVGYSGKSTWPAGNLFSPNWTTIGFVNYANGRGGDYRLSPASAYKGKALDGKDPGADIDLVMQYTNGVK